MKTLIVTTGTRDFLLNNYLPTLKNNAKYTGDILLIDYVKIPNNYRVKDPIKDTDIPLLEKNYNIIFRRIEYKYHDLPSDRIRAFYKCLKKDSLWKKYDIIMVTDGNDITFYKSLEPLFNIAKKQVCYVTEREHHKCGKWINYESYKYPEGEKVWNVIINKPMINAGMIVGSSKNMMEVLGFITNMMKYNSNFGADQLLLNALIYYYNYPAQEVSKIWNYCLACGIIRMVSIRGNNVITRDEYCNKIVILHRNAIHHGAAHQDLDWWLKMKFPACKLPEEGWM